MSLDTVASSLKTVERRIGGMTYRVTELPAFPAFVMGRKLASIIGPALGGIIMASMKGTDAERRAGVVAALGQVVDRLDDRTDALVRDLAQHAEVHYRGVWMKVNVETPEHLQDAGCLLELVGLVLEVNLASFTSALGGNTPPGGMSGSTKRS